MAEDRHAKAAEDARHDLERLKDQGEVLGTSAAVRAAKKAQSHFSAADAPHSDPIEIWGTRIGRALAVVFVIALIWWLATTYLFR